MIIMIVMSAIVIVRVMIVRGVVGHFMRCAMPMGGIIAPGMCVLNSRRHDPPCQHQG